MSLQYNSISILKVNAKTQVNAPPPLTDWQVFTSKNVKNVHSTWEKREITAKPQQKVTAAQTSDRRTMMQK